MKKLIITVNPDGTIKSETFGFDSPECIDKAKEVLEGVVDYSEAKIEVKDTSMENLQDDYTGNTIHE